MNKKRSRNVQYLKTLTRNAKPSIKTKVNKIIKLYNDSKIY